MQWKVVVPLYRYREYPTLRTILYFYENHIRPKNGVFSLYLACICPVLIFLSSKASAWPCGRWIVFPAPYNLSHRRNVERLSLLYRYFHCKCSEGLNSLSPPVLVVSFAAGTRHATYTRMNHPHSLHNRLIRRKFLSDSLFKRTTGRMFSWSL